jgi:eukaryotic-like serine/threonine-protein kinase
VAAIPNRRIEGKYEILQKIREGGMGAIYKVRHRLLDEVRVIKMMRPQLDADAEFKARFIREARVAIKLRHPNVAHLYDFTIGDDDVAFIVMEFIDGRTLEELLKAVGPPPLGLAIEIAQQSLRALGYLHSKGFVHRDISPDNLMLTEDPDGNPQIKLIDLGIAKVVGGADAHLTKTGTFLGKLRYASPEQFSAAGVPSADARGDLYSFGVVLYELLTGVHPILGSDPSSIIAGHLFRPPLPFDQTDPDGRLPPALRAAVMRALAKSPDERYASARELAQELAACRQPGDLLQGDWRQVLEQSVAPLRPTAADTAAEEAAGRPSSTQLRLDEHFGPTTTPTPSLLMEVAAAGISAAAASAAAAGAPAAPAATAAAAAPAAPAAPAAREPAAAAPDPAADAPPEARVGPAASAPPTIFAAELAPLLDDARALAASENLKEAGKLLRRAERMAPASPDVRELREQIDEASRRRAEERRRATQIARKAAEIGKRLDRGDLDGGATLLAAAAAELGEAEAWPALRDRLADLRVEMRLAEVGALLMSARLLWANDELDQALEAVASARRLEPENPAVQALAEELEVAVAQRERERRRSEKLAQTVAAVSAKLERDELEEASKLLDWAVVRFGAAPTLREQWERLEQRKRQAVARRIVEVLSRTERLAAAGDLGGARGALEEARALADKAPELRTQIAEADAALSRQADRRRAERPDPAGPVEGLLRDARLLMQVDDHEDAVRKLLQALELAPGHPAAQALLEQARAAVRRRRGAPPAGDKQRH